MEDDGSPDNVYVESAGERYRVMRLRDFKKFREFALGSEGWSQAHKDPKITVESRPPEDKSTGLNIVRVNVEMPEVDPELLYDSLHDPDYRKSWDENMLAGYNIVELDERNDIGYYAAKFPRFVANRDFCNMRSWMEFSNGDFLIMNHSEPHPQCPEKKDFVRARSIMTGYYIRPRDGGGCTMIYISQSDLKGSIPKMLINSGMTTMAPNLMKKLETCAKNYKTWSEKNYEPGFRGKWRTPKISWDEDENQSSSPREAPKATPMSTLTDGEGSSHKQQMDDGEFDEKLEAPRNNGGANLAGSQRPSATNMSNEQVQVLQQQIEDLKRQLFVANQRSDQAASLAPVAPARSEDSMAIQQYRALMNDATNFIDRQYMQEGRVPTTREYLTRLHCVVEGMQRTIPAAH